MSQTVKKRQATDTLQDMIEISLSDEELDVPAKICWNTGEEKNCIACFLSKGCKAK
jgi:hypothetical protein